MVYRESRRHQPCLRCHPQSYIRMVRGCIDIPQAILSFCRRNLVQHLIERCLLFHMTRDDCIQALAKHASIQPVVTLTVWKELLKENRSFFQAYNQVVPQSPPQCDPSTDCTSSSAINIGGEESREVTRQSRSDGNGCVPRWFV